MSRLGKCTNYSGCLLAYRGEETNIPDGQAFVCAECGKPLTEVKASAKGLMLYGGIGLAVVILGAGAFFGLKKFKSKPSSTSSTPAMVDAPSPSSTDPTPMRPKEPVKRAQMEETESPTIPNPESKGVAEPPKEAVVETKIGAEIDSKVKAEVLKRVDLMPGLSATDKDKLYNSVDRARKMTLVITIPFAKGGTAINQGDLLALKTALTMPETAGLLRDPLAAFVILGYADPKGDPKGNLKYSKDRAEAVAAVIKTEVRDLNLVRAVAMGGSTLLDGQSLEKNRIAEVWIVLP